MHAARKGWAVVFALNHVLRLAVIESEHFIGEVEAVSHDSEPVLQTIAGLGIELKVRVKIIVAERTSRSPRSGSRAADTLLLLPVPS